MSLEQSFLLQQITVISFPLMVSFDGLSYFPILFQHGLHIQVEYHIFSHESQPFEFEEG